MFIYLLWARWGEYSDADDTILGVYSSRKKAKTDAIKQLLAQNNGQGIWPFNHMLREKFNEDEYAWNSRDEMVYAFTNNGRIYIEGREVQ